MADLPAKSFRDSVAENVTLLIAARVSMALALPMISGMAFLGWAYVQSQFKNQDGKMDRQQAQMIGMQADQRDANSDLNEVSTRITVVENNMSVEARNNAQFRETMILKMDRFEESIRHMSNSMAALTATLNADRRNEDIRTFQERNWRGQER